MSISDQVDVNQAGGAIVLFTTDLFSGMNIAHTARQLGFTVTRVESTTAFIAEMQSQRQVVLGIVDASSPVDWNQLTDQKLAVPFIAFGPHKNVEALKSAKRAGATRVMANSEFHQKMAVHMSRYALDSA